jgi:hypothetical protein
MGYWKNKMIEEQDRGWSSVEKNMYAVNAWTTMRYRPLLLSTRRRKSVIIVPDGLGNIRLVFTWTICLN